MVDTHVLFSIHNHYHHGHGCYGLPSILIIDSITVANSYSNITVPDYGNGNFSSRVSVLRLLKFDLYFTAALNTY